MGRTKANGQKSPLDKLYTTDENALYCAELIDYSKYDLIIEPSAGGGSFLRALETLQVKTPILAYDLLPEADNVIKTNFLKLEEPQGYENILVLGNPPYGQQNTLAVAFMNKCMQWSSVKEVAFIIPKSFRKPSVQERVSLDFGVTLDKDLPSDHFLLDGVKCNVNTCFQVWSRLDEPRVKTVKRKTTPLFSLVTDKSDAHCRIQRVGGRAGKASKDLTPSTASNYLIKLDGIVTPDKVEEFIQLVNSLEFPTVNYTVGPKSISLDELITVVEEAYFKK